jgi:hypothetical protein
MSIVDDDLDDASRAAMEASVEESYVELERGELAPAEDVIASLRSVRSEE